MLGVVNALLCSLKTILLDNREDLGFELDAKIFAVDRVMKLIYVSQWQAWQSAA